MKNALKIGLLALVTGCAGVENTYDAPAAEGQIPHKVVPITASLTESLQVESPLAGSAPLGTPSRDSYQYQIGPADVLAIFVDQPLFADESNGAAGSVQPPSEPRLYTVSEKGEIFLPLHGPLAVSGLTITEAYESILGALQAFFARPQINVSVAEFRSQKVAVVFGAGGGRYLPVTNRPMAILDAVLLASEDRNLAEDFDARGVILKRDGREYGVDLTALSESPNFGSDWLLKDGDVVVLPPNRNGVYLLGEIPNQRRLINPYSTPLAEVMFPPVASGQQQAIMFQQRNNYLNLGSVDIGSIFVIRGDTQFANVFHLNARTPDAMLLAERFPMQDGDVVFVSTRSITRFNRYIAEFLPSLAPLLIASQFTD